MTRLLFFATHPYSTNGYSRVAYEFVRRLCKKDDVNITWYGFQYFHKNNPQIIRSIPSNVTVYDAFENENPKAQGFGFTEVAKFVDDNGPFDVLLIYNDPVVISQILDKLKECKKPKTFKVALYFDTVYQTQRKVFINKFNEEVDHVICFTKYWEENVKSQGLKKPTYVLEHGLDPLMNFPVPKKLARLHFGLKNEDFIVFNANRSQPRKRWDIMLQAWAEIVSRHLNEPIKLLIGTHPQQGSWDLLEVYEHELRRRGISFQDGMKHVILIDNPQQLSDEDMNILHNACDVGINTAQGEGIGLLTYEGGLIGIPQIVPNVGGLKDCFDKTNCLLVDPILNIYTDYMTDGAPGLAEVCSPMDFAEAIDVYYADEDIRKKHGSLTREKIIKNYNWDNLTEKLYKILKTIDPPKVNPDVVDLKNITITDVSYKTIKQFDEEKLMDIKNVAPPNTPAKKNNKKDDIRERLRKKLEAKKKESNDILKLKEQIDQLLSEKQK